MTIKMHIVDHNKNQTKLAYMYCEGDLDKPVIVFCGGYKSDMQGTKAQFIEDFAAQKGYGSLRFDYAGHGRSEGLFEDGTIGSWTKDAKAIIAHCIKDRDIILIGSSMGGWIALLCALALGTQVKGIIGIAPAPDFTRDMVNEFSDDMKADLDLNGYVELPNDYSDEPYRVTKQLIEEGEALSLLHAQIDITCPVHLIHSQKDTVVSWEKSLQIQDCLKTDHVVLKLLKDGDHSVSRPQDLALLAQSIEALA